jgi:hypothetical protein
VLCRIELGSERGRLVVHVAGRLTGAQVPDLMEMCAKASDPPLLELHDLISADAIGTDALVRLAQRGAQFVALPEYLRLKLEAHEREQSP